MDEAALSRKNNISANLFLVAAVLMFLGTILTFLFTLFFVTDIINPHYFMPPLYKIAFFLLDFLCVAAVAALVAGYYLIKNRSRHARTAAVISLVLTFFTFAPLVVILIYPLVFLLGDEGKNFYKIS